MSDPRDWSDQDYADFDARFDADDIPEVTFQIATIVTEATEGNWNNTAGGHTDSKGEIKH